MKLALHYKTIPTCFLSRKWSKNGDQMRKIFLTDCFRKSHFDRTGQDLIARLPVPVATLVCMFHSVAFVARILRDLCFPWFVFKEADSLGLSPDHFSIYLKVLNIPYLRFLFAGLIQQRNLFETLVFVHIAYQSDVL